MSRSTRSEGSCPTTRLTTTAMASTTAVVAAEVIPFRRWRTCTVRKTKTAAMDR